MAASGKAFRQAGRLLSFAAALLLALSLFGEDAAAPSKASAMMETKLYVLKNVPASDIAPFVDLALKKAAQQGTAESVVSNGRSLLLVNAPQDRIALIDEMVAKLDVPSQSPKALGPPGQGYSSYKGRFVPVKSLASMIATLSLEMGGDGRVLQDASSVYWKGDPKLDEAVGRLMAKADVPQSQMRMVFRAYVLSASTVGVMSEILLSRRPEDVKAPDAAIIATITGCGGVKLLGSTECSVSQGVNISKAAFDSSVPGGLSITVSYPVISSGGSKPDSVYSDFIFDNGAEGRNARWTLKSGIEKPLAAFSLRNGGKGRERAHYIDISSLPSLFRGGDKSAVSGDMLIVTGLATEAQD